jgi:hypothetical protein
MVLTVMVDDGLTRSGDVAMREWMMGLGFIAILMTPCFIAMRPGADRSEETAEDQKDGDRSARRLKLL